MVKYDLNEEIPVVLRVRLSNYIFQWPFPREPQHRCPLRHCGLRQHGQTDYRYGPVYRREMHQIRPSLSWPMSLMVVCAAAK